jgi:hypothetical protein
VGGGQSTNFTPEKETRCPLHSKFGEPQGPSGRVRKISPKPGLDLRTVQAAASRYTDYAIPARNDAVTQINLKLRALLSNLTTLPVLKQIIELHGLTF